MTTCQAQGALHAWTRIFVFMHTPTYALEKDFTVANTTLPVREHIIHHFRPTKIAFSDAIYDQLMVVQVFCHGFCHNYLNLKTRIMVPIYQKINILQSKFCNTAMKKTTILFS